MTVLEKIQKLTVSDCFKKLSEVLACPPQEDRNKNKLKYFKLTITEGFWGSKITWEEREVPLTDEELKLKNY